MYYIDDEELEALRALFKSKKFYRYNSAGDTDCDLFEKEYSAYIGTKNSLILNSGTNALLASLMASGIQPGDEVLIPTYTFVATAAAVVQAGAIPVLVNINDNLSIDFADAATKLTSKTKAVILVHMDGLAADISEALEFCKKNKILLIEDVAQAIGGSYQNKRLGTFGLFGCYSLNENKNISCGEGGILVTDDSVLFQKALCYHDTPAQFSPSKKDFFNSIDTFMGASMRVSNIQGAIMRVQLRRLDKILADLRARKKIFADYLKNQKKVKVILGHDVDGDCASALHLIFNDVSSAALDGKVLRQNQLMFAPVTVRPAHASWKWTHLFSKQGHLQTASNPFLQAQNLPNYDAANYVNSVDILMRVLKMDINIELSLSETEIQAQKLIKLLS